MSITAIPTHYAGCLFRSRLEARWAVFFDYIGARWEYEPQGYLVELRDGVVRPYLPDFLLTDCGTWIEVKGNPSPADEMLALAAASQLPKMKSQRGEDGPDFMLLGNLPELHDDRTDWGWLSYSHECRASDETCHFGFESGNRLCGSSFYGFGPYRKNYRPWWMDPGCRWGNDSRCHSFDPVLCDEAGDPGAYRAARSARFEHGHSGRVL